MKTKTRRIGQALGLLFILALGLHSCSGPERAPHQPITGVDKPLNQEQPTK